MANIFEVKTKDGKIIRLTERQWLHIKQRHPEMANRLNDIEDAIANPTARIQYSEEVTKFYKFIKDGKKYKKYIMAAVKILNGDGFVITAYKTRRIS